MTNSLICNAAFEWNAPIDLCELVQVKDGQSSEHIRRRPF